MGTGAAWLHVACVRVAVGRLSVVPRASIWSLRMGITVYRVWKRVARVSELNRSSSFFMSNPYSVEFRWRVLWMYVSHYVNHRCHKLNDLGDPVGTGPRVTMIIVIWESRHVFGDPWQNHTSCLCMRAHVLARLYPYLYTLPQLAIGSLRMAQLHYCQRRSIKIGYYEAIDCLESEWRWILATIVHGGIQ